MLRGRARTSFPVQSSHTDTKAKETHSPPCVQHLLHVAASPSQELPLRPGSDHAQRGEEIFREENKKQRITVESFGFVFVCKHLRAHMQVGDRMDEQRLPAAYSCISPPPSL